MKVTVSEATGKVLDLLVAAAEGIPLRKPVRATNADVEHMAVPFELFDVEVIFRNDKPVSAKVRQIKVIRYGIAKDVAATAPSITFIDSKGQKAWGSVDLFFLDKEEAELETLAAVKGEFEYFHPSTDREQGYQIVEREKMLVMWDATNQWKCVLTPNMNEPHFYYRYYASTPLIAAMRCYVTKKFGDEVEVPDELLR
jgi:hypothetical protein